ADMILHDFNELGKLEGRPVAVLEKYDIRSRDELLERGDRNCNLVQRRVVVNADAELRKRVRQIEIKLHRVVDGRRVIERHAAKHAVRAGFLSEARFPKRISGMERRAADENGNALPDCADRGLDKFLFFFPEKRMKFA